MRNLRITSYSFGEMLKTYRKSRRLTQRQLAQQLSVHANTVSSWELGTYLPATRGLVLELAQHLGLDDSETRSFLEASLTALSPYWYVPFPRNPFFTGREEVLEELHKRLHAEQVIALTQTYALHGLGGIGKTQLALEYAYRHALEYSAIFWIGAETFESVVSNLLRIAEALGLPEREDKDQHRVLAAVQRWLSTHSQWLVIWDNVEDLAVLDRFLPTTRSGTMLITTRCRVLGTRARGLDLMPMEHEEGIVFLLRRAKMLEPEATGEQIRQLAARKPAQYRAAADLVMAMGGLPLALDQAGAYLETTQCGLLAYLDLFRTRRAILLQQRGEGACDHPASVSTTFALAVAAAAHRHPAVGDLLRVCALLQPDAIPEGLFRQGGKHLGGTLEVACRDALEWDRVISIACGYSLLSRQPEEQTFSLHRLVQAVLLDAMTQAEREQRSRRVIESLDAVFPEVQLATGYVSWKQSEQLLPHALLCLRRPDATEESLTLASLAHKTAQYLRTCGRYAEAMPLFQRALQIHERVLGPEHPEVATSLNYLAVLYAQQGSYAEATPLFQRALQIHERVLGPEHAEVARELHNLALLYTQQGRYVEAEPLFQRALHIREQILGSEHSYVGSTLNNLADLYVQQGRYAEAEPLLQRALSIWEQAQASEHPYAAYALNNLAEIYREQGRYAEAEPRFRRALYIWEQSLGPEHPDVARALDSLGHLFFVQGEYAEAEAFYQRALHIWEQGLEPKHPDIAFPLNNLANLYREQGKDMEAEAFYQRALDIREQHLGQHHPETAQILHDLAIFYQKQGNLGEALSLADRALQIRSQSLGNTHPKTVATRMLYAQLLEAPTDAEQDRRSQEQVAKDGNRFRKAEEGRSVPVSTQAAPTFPAMGEDPFETFLAACCELHPRAWCRSSELWQTYEQWREQQQERYPLSRGAFIIHLKALGCRAARTKKARIWRGIGLVSQNNNGG